MYKLNVVYENFQYENKKKQSWKYGTLNKLYITAYQLKR